MLANPFSVWPVGAALVCWIKSLMDVILHIGAHRTATTAFQQYMHDNAEWLAASGTGFWGPEHTRAGVFSGMYEMRPGVGNTRKMGAELVAEMLRVETDKGVQRLIISDENLMGSVRQNIRDELLYPAVATRITHAMTVLGGRVRQIVIAPRSLETYWCSALAYGVGRGAPVPSRAKLTRIAASRRTWRDVIMDIADAAPAPVLTVTLFEKISTRPDEMLSAMGIEAVPKAVRRGPVNVSPDLPQLRRVLRDRGADHTALPFGMGRWNPFTNAEHDALREHYADDMMWLTAGASGVAKLTEDRLSERAGKNLPRGAQCKGQTDEFQERHVARPG